MSEMAFLLKKVVSVLILPPTGPLLLALLGLALWPRSRRLGGVLAWSGVVGLAALSTPMVADGLHGLLGEYRTVDLSAAREARAIVLLSGGLKQAAEWGGDTPKGYSLERARYAARLARQTGLPLLVSGGTVFGGTPEAQLLRELLEREFGVRVRWTESASRDTHENAMFSAAILRRDGIQRIVLVTHAFHMRRAGREFVAAGIEVVPAPVVVRTGAPARSFVEWLPNQDALSSSTVALHELLGQLAQRWGLGAR